MCSNFKDISAGCDIGSDDNNQKTCFNEITINDGYTRNLSSIFADQKFFDKLSSSRIDWEDVNKNNDESKDIVANIMNELIEDLKLH